MKSINQGRLSFWVIGLMIIATPLLHGCKKDLPDQNNQNSGKEITEINVNPGFSWETVKILQCSFSATVSGVLFVKSTDGKTMYHKGYLDATKPYEINIPLPTYLTEVMVQLNGDQVNISVSGTTISHHF